MKRPASRISQLLTSKNIQMWRLAPAASPAVAPAEYVLVPPTLKIEPYARLSVHNALYSVGSFTYCMSSLPASVSIGRYCSIAIDVRVLGFRHPYERVSTSPFTYDQRFVDIYAELNKGTEFAAVPYAGPEKSGIDIGHDVWIGEGVSIVGSVKIGTGAVIAGKSHVVKDVEPYTIVGGNPAKVIKRRFSSDSLIADLLASEWWKYKFHDFSGMSFDNPQEFLIQLRERQAAGTIRVFRPAPVTYRDVRSLE